MTTLQSFSGQVPRSVGLDAARSSGKKRAGAGPLARLFSLCRPRRPVHSMAISPSAEKRRNLVEAHIGGSALTSGARSKALRSPP